MTVRVSGHAYPWDVVGDPGFAERVVRLGVPEVTLAAAYHSTRAATPLHPEHRVVEAPMAALYRPVRGRVWGGRRLRPVGADWVAARDPFGVAAEALRRNGLRVAAWIVLTHNTRLGNEFPDLAVRNCFGDRYPYALCPGHAEVREYAATLAGEAVAGVAVDGVSLEACGQLGIEHNSHHEKTAGAWTAEQARVLSVCCCAACRSGWRARGLDPAEVVARLKGAAHGGGPDEQGGRGPDPAQVDTRLEGAVDGGGLDEEWGRELLAVRHESADLLRGEVLQRLREEAPGVPVTLHAHPDPWVTGASPGLTEAAAREVDGLLVPAWPTEPASAELVAAAISTGLRVDAGGTGDAVGRAVREDAVGTGKRDAGGTGEWDAGGTGVRVDAYVTVLPPADSERVVEHVGRLLRAGVGGINLYHLGLAPGERLAVLGRVVDLVE